MVAGAVHRDGDRGIVYFQNVAVHARGRVKVIYLTPRRRVTPFVHLTGSITCRFHIPDFTPIGQFKWEGRIAFRSVHPVHEARLAVPLLSRNSRSLCIIAWRCLYRMLHLPLRYMYSAGRKAFASSSRYVTSTESIFTKLTLAGQLLVKNSCTEFHEILTSVLTAKTTSQTDRRSGVISA